MPRPTPFQIFIDTAEQLPFTFQGIYGDADANYDLWDVQTARVCLGRHPNSLGDYSVSDGVGHCAVERKSMNDGHSTILGFKDDHRARFEAELANMQNIEAPLVILECSFEEFICCAPETPYKTQAENAKNLFRSVLALQQKYRVSWIFAGDRASAEQVTFHWLKRWWDKHREKIRAELIKGLNGSGMKTKSSIPF